MVGMCILVFKDGTRSKVAVTVKEAGEAEEEEVAARRKVSTETAEAEEGTMMAVVEAVNVEADNV